MLYFSSDILSYSNEIAPQKLITDFRYTAVKKINGRTLEQSELSKCHFGDVTRASNFYNMLCKRAISIFPPWNSGKFSLSKQKVLSSNRRQLHLRSPAIYFFDSCTEYEIKFIQLNYKKLLVINALTLLKEWN